MIPEGQRSEQVSLDIDLAAKIRLGEAQRLSAEHHRDHGRRRSKTEREWRVGTGRLFSRNAHVKRGPAPEPHGNAHVKLLE